MSETARQHRLGVVIHQAGRWLRGVRIAYLPRFDRRPPVRLHLGPTVPGWALRLATGLLGGSVLAAITPNRGLLVLAVATALLLVIWPGRLLPATVAIVVGILLAVATEPSIARTAALVLGLHLMAVLGGVAAQVSARARIEVAVLVAPLRRLLAVQLIAQPVALVGALVAGAHLSLSVLPVLAVLGLAALVLLWAPSLDQAE